MQTGYLATCQVWGLAANRSTWAHSWLMSELLPFTLSLLLLLKRRVKATRRRVLSEVIFWPGWQDHGVSTKAFQVFMDCTHFDSKLDLFQLTVISKSWVTVILAKIHQDAWKTQTSFQRGIPHWLVFLKWSTILFSHILKMYTLTESKLWWDKTFRTATVKKNHWRAA